MKAVGEAPRRVYMVTPSGEILLKSPPTRKAMVKRLVEAISDSLRRAGLTLRAYRVNGARLLLECEGPVNIVLYRLSRVFGVQYASAALEHEFKSLDELASIVEKYYSQAVRGRRFAVRVHRHGRHDFTSLDVARIVGARLKPYSSGVDLENPDVEVFVEVRGWRAYTYTDSERVQGPGGLPPGSEGRGLVLFSGGLDSPVAAWYTAKRGVIVDFLHAIVSSPASLYYALKVAKRLAMDWLNGYEPYMIVVDLTKPVRDLMSRLPRRLWMLGFKKILYSVADSIASSKGYDVLVTGESIGQTSSQTIANIKALHEVTQTSRPIIRPLAGMAKLEIEEIARRIGVYEEASKTIEYSALARRGATPRASTSDIELLRGFNAGGERILLNVNLLRDEWSSVLMKLPLEIDYVPADAAIISASGAKELREASPKPVLVTYANDAERGDVVELVKRLRGKGVHAYAYYAPDPKAVENARIRIEPGERVDLSLGVARHH